MSDNPMSDNPMSENPISDNPTAEAVVMFKTRLTQQHYKITVLGIGMLRSRG